VHAVRFRTPDAARALDTVWDSDFLRLSCELEGHPLGGGLLKLEPGEAARIVVPAPAAFHRMPAATHWQGAVSALWLRLGRIMSPRPQSVDGLGDRWVENKVGEISLLNASSSAGHA
jgi:hypothetical protein